MNTGHFWYTRTHFPWSFIICSFVYHFNSPRGTQHCNNFGARNLSYTSMIYQVYLFTTEWREVRDDKCHRNNDVPTLREEKHKKPRNRTRTTGSSSGVQSQKAVSLALQSSSYCNAPRSNHCVTSLPKVIYIGDILPCKGELQ